MSEIVPLTIGKQLPRRPRGLRVGRCRCRRASPGDEASGRVAVVARTYLERIPAWTSELTADKPGSQARIIRAYSQPDALRRVADSTNQVRSSNRAPQASLVSVSALAGRVAVSPPDPVLALAYCDAQRGGRARHARLQHAVA